MKTLYLLIIILSSGIAAADNVTDYFKRIPPQIFAEGTPAELVRLANSGHGIVDTKNGYMSLDGDGAQVSLQVALFRYADGSPLLIVAWGDLEEPDYTHLTLFREQNGRMIVADRAIFPKADSPNLRFSLPRHGRIVIVKNAAGKMVGKWIWDGSQFAQNQ